MDVKPPATTEPSLPGADHRTSTANACRILASIIVLSLGVDLFFFNGYLVSDDQQYWRGGLAILDGHFGPAGPSLGEMRLTLTGWNALIIALVGPRIQLVAASYVVFHQLLNLATFVLGARLFSARVGLLAAYLSALTPLLLNFSTVMLPDIPQTLWIVLSFLAFHEAYRLRGRRRGPLAGLLLLLAGVFAGLAYATKESGLIVLPFYFVLWIVLERRIALDQKQQRYWLPACAYGALFAAGIAIIFIAETAALSALNDGILVRMGWTSEDLAPGRVARIERVAGLDPLKRVDRIRQIVTDDTYLPASLRWFLLFGLVVYPFLKRRPWAILLLPLWTFVYMTWGTMNLSRYIPPIIHTRYFTIVLPFLFLMASVSLWRLWTAGPGRLPFKGVRAGLSAIGLAVVVAVPLTWLETANRRAGGISRARIIGPAARAVVHAQRSSTRPVVMSGTVSRLLREVFPDRPPDQLVCATDVTPEMLRAFAEDGGFEYIELDERTIRVREGRRSKWVVIAALDQILHPLARGEAACLKDDFPWNDVWTGWSVAPAALPQFCTGDYVYTLRERMTAARASTRLADLWALIGNEVAAPEPIGRRTFATVYRVDAERVGTADATDQTSAGAAVDLTPTLGQWRVWKADDFSIKRGADRPARVSIRLPPGKKAWYVLPKSHPQGVRELPSAGRWLISVEIESESSVELDLWLRLFADRAVEQEIMDKYVSMDPGRNRIGVFVPDPPVFFYPAFRVTGEGEFCVTSFSLTRWDPAPRDEQPATTEPSPVQ